MIPPLTDQEIARFRAAILIGEGCHLWQRETNNNGYGRFPIYRKNARIRILAHRLAFFLANGYEPADKVVLRHTCDTPACCRADHLVIGTQADNLRDAMDRGRTNVDGLTAQRDQSVAAFRARIERGEKHCFRCKQIKPLNAFQRNRSALDGHQGECKPCRTVEQRERRKLQRTAVAA
jgi:hypothetical protein